MESSKNPMLRVCVTERCQHSCIYCRPGGESCHSGTKKEMTPQQIHELVSIMVHNGIRFVKVTGGEPLLRPGILDVLKGIKSIEGVESLELITRHPKSIGLIEDLEDIGVSCLNYSLDTLSPSTFKMISGTNSLEGVVAAIRRAHKSRMKLKINMVVMRGVNDHEIPAMIEFAGENEAELKLLDLMNIPEDPNFLQNHYYDFNELVPILEATAIEIEHATPPGGIGTPMPRYHLANHAIVSIKDARVGTWYGEPCTKCDHYPCQDALMALRLTADGFLQRCLIRSDTMEDLLSVYRDHGPEAAEQVAINVLATFREATYAGPVWKP